MTVPRVALDRWKLASLALIPVSLILIMVFTVLDIRTAADPPFLLTVLNTVFIGIIPLVVALIAFRSYRSSGSTSLFLLGSGMMIFGLGSIAAGWLIGLRDGPNISVTIYNICVFVSAVFYLTGAFLTFTRSRSPGTAGHSWKIAAMTGGIITFVAVFILLAVAGSIPPFFIVGSGPTLLRQIILSNGIAFLAIASILLIHLFALKREDFFFWYAVSLAVIAIGLIAAFLTPVMGSPVNWVSRAMQYVGAGFALVAIIVTGRLAQDRGHSLEETLGRFFSEAEAGYKSLIETATDAIVVFDSSDRVIVWNRAAENMFGYGEREALGSSFFSLAIPDEYVARIKNNFRTPAANDTDQDTHNSMEILARRKDGSTFPAEIALSRHPVAGTWASTGIIRDITMRKQTSEELRQKNTDLGLLNEELTATQHELQERNDELIRSEQDLAVKNAQLQGLFDYSAASLVLFNATKPYTVLAHNKYYQQLWNEPYRSNGMVEKNLLDYVPEVEVSGVMAVFDEVVATRQPRSLINFPYEGMERGRTYWNWHLSPIMQGGEVIALAHLGIDVTNEVIARMKVEEMVAALRESEERLRLAEEAGNIGVWDWDLVTKEVRWTPQLEAIYGLEPGSVRTYGDFQALVHPDDIGRVEKAQTEAVEQHRSFEYEFRFRRADGEIGWVYCRGRAVYDEEGRPIRQFGVNIDITDRKKAEETLRESDFRLQMALKAGKLGWHDYTPATGQILWDMNCRRMWGLGPDDPVDINVFWAGIHPDSVTETQEKLAASIDPDGDGHFDSDYLVRPLDGSPDRWVHATGQTIFSGDGADRHAVHMIGTVQDVTGRKQVENALRESEKKYRTLFETMTEGFSIVEIVFDETGKPVDLRNLMVNPAFQHHTGLMQKRFSG